MHVHITFRVTRDLHEDAMAAGMAWLSSEERTRCSRLMFSVDRRDFAAAHILLRQSLSASELRDPREWAFVRSPSGKPLLDDREDRGRRLAFNLSHTRGMVACVVARGADVGIDVERVSASGDMLDLARRWFSSRELTDLERCEDSARAARFTEMWTLKEAHVKATGAGILGGLDAPAFSFGAEGSLYFEPGDASDADTWQFALFGVLDYRLAVAVRNPNQDAATLSINQPVDEGSPNSVEARLLRISRQMVVFGK